MEINHRSQFRQALGVLASIAALVATIPATVGHATMVGFNATYTAGDASIAVGSGTIGAGSPSGGYGSSVLAAGSGANDYKLFNTQSDWVIPNGAVLTWSFDARFVGYAGDFWTTLSIQGGSPSPDKPGFSLKWFDGTDPYGTDGQWHHYQTTLTYTDPDTGGSQSTDWVISLSDGTGFTFQLDNIRLTNASTLQQYWTAVGHNANLDNGDFRGISTAGQDENVFSQNGSQSFLVMEDLVPEPSTALLFGLGGLVLWRSRKRLA